MKNLSKKNWLLAFSLVIISCFSFVSCSDDDKDSGSGIVGTWGNYAYVYHFDSNGSGYFQYAPTNGAYDAVGEVKSHFRWSASSTILSMTYDGSGTTAAHTSTFYYEVDNSLLVLIDMDNGDTTSLTRK